MWITDALGCATWQDDHSKWCVEARGGSFGVSILDSGDSISGDSISTEGDSARQASESPSPWVSFTPVDLDQLPAVGEQFVRGNELHLAYPQCEGVYELRLVLKPIESRRRCLVLQASVAIQTDRLDSYPKLDVDVVCDAIRTLGPAESVGDGGSDVGFGPGSISVATSREHSVSVLLGPRDSPFTTNHSLDSRLRLRLFGDFLEKGVIRKATVWIVISRDAAPCDDAALRKWWTQLSGIPLPLTA